MMQMAESFCLDLGPPMLALTRHDPILMQHINKKDFKRLLDRESIVHGYFSIYQMHHTIRLAQLSRPIKERSRHSKYRERSEEGLFETFSFTRRQQNIEKLEKKAKVAKYQAPVVRVVYKKRDRSQWKRPNQ
jgi:hypothetical protein